MPTPTAATLTKTLKSFSNPQISAHSQRFFKTGPGEYGEGDRFLGIRVPTLRLLAKQHKSLPIDETEKLLHSPFHEARLLAALLLVQHFETGDAATRETVYQRYLANTAYLNGWDLVDASAHKIVGPWLENRPHDILLQLARSSSLWERRIAIISTFHLIRQGQTQTTLAVSEILVHDTEDLIHKAVGWMLRELGKRNQPAEEAFLQKHLKTLPRTLLRYAIEKFPEPLRKRYLAATPTKT